MEAQWTCRIIDMSEKFSGEDSGGQAWWWIYGTTGMDMSAEKMWDGNR